MKPALFLTAAIALTACVPVGDVLVKNGVSHDRYERDLIECFSRASQAIPNNTQMAYDPFIGLHTADTNASARVSSTQICMRDRGYQMASIPPCMGKSMTDAMIRARSEASRSDVIQIGPQSCFVRIYGKDAPFFWTQAK